MHLAPEDPLFLSAAPFSAIIAGLLVGAGFALAIWALSFTGLERRHPGAAGSLGLLALCGLCLAADGWILAGIVGFCAGYGGLLQLGGGGGGDRRAPRGVPAPAPVQVAARIPAAPAPAFAAARPLRAGAPAGLRTAPHRAAPGHPSQARPAEPQARDGPLRGAWV
ncbi:hypothetical protein ACQ5SO_09710 [Rhodovulum sp. DZ06]|uniref:hypothetical protein n=1 Tax=Rhodovulum sp. DZ06 TaxID=3425126 RepID=UPI003D34304C